MENENGNTADITQALAQVEDVLQALHVPIVVDDKYENDLSMVCTAVVPDCVTLPSRCEDQSTDIGKGGEGTPDISDEQFADLYVRLFSKGSTDPDHIDSAAECVEGNGIDPDLNDNATDCIEGYDST